MSTKKPLRRNCRNCRFWDPQPLNVLNLGYCRHHAPVSSVNAVAFPTTTSIDWCGDHQPLPTDADNPNAAADHTTPSYGQVLDALAQRNPKLHEVACYHVCQVLGATFNETPLTELLVMAQTPQKRKDDKP